MSRAFAGLALLFWITSAPAAAVESREVDRTFPLEARGTVSIQSFKGSLDVETWGEARAEVTARIEPDTTCGSEAEQAERVRLTEVEIDSTGSRLTVRSNYDRLQGLPSIHREIDGLHSTCSSYPFVRYRLRIPATARLEIEDHKSEISVDGLRADARIHTHKGHVVVKGHDGGLELSTHKGDARVEYARLSEPSRLETYKGTSRSHCRGRRDSTWTHGSSVEDASTRRSGSTNGR